jgi:2,3,4,5-tetrahydropyridine-2-carboxylate N-succinyltransferase
MTLKTTMKRNPMSNDLENECIHDLEDEINNLWDDSNHVNASQIVHRVLSLLDQGSIRVCEKVEGEWMVHEWIKKAILLHFKLTPPFMKDGGVGGTPWFDKIDPKFSNWTEGDFQTAMIRVVPGSFVRFGSYIEPKTILMPSFINIGAYVGSGTMVDTWVTIGSCAQIGKNCHISGGVGIGGVLEPIQAKPVIIEDNCFIGARSEIAEGVKVGEGAVVSMGVFIGASTKIINRETGEIIYGEVPPYSVVVPGTLPHKDPTKPALACAVIVKTVDEKTRFKTSLTDLLRGF